MNCDLRQDMTLSGPLFRFLRAIRSVRCGQGEQGSTLVEFSLATTLLLTMMFGVMDFGRALYTYTEVSEAAAKNNATPIPISASAKRRRRLTGVAGLARNCSTNRKFIAPNPSSMRNRATLAPTITP